jgi:hypothetical protein
MRKEKGRVLLTLGLYKLIPSVVEGLVLSFGVYPECNRREGSCLSRRSLSEGGAMTGFYPDSSGLARKYKKKESR